MKKTAFVLATCLVSLSGCKAPWEGSEAIPVETCWQPKTKAEATSLIKKIVVDLIEESVKAKHVAAQEKDRLLMRNKTG